MKKFSIFTVFTIIFSSYTYAQPIVSLGELKIGMTEQEFLEIPEIKSRDFHDAGDTKYNSNESVNLKKTADSAVPEYYAKMPEFWKIYTPEYITYEFKLATGVKDFLSNDYYKTTVEFYKNELVSIRLDVSASFSKYEEILTEKYGKPTTRNSMKIETCQNGYGAKSQHNTGFISSIWGERNQISAVLKMSNSDCGKNPGASYSIYSKKSLLLNEIERKAREKAISKATKDKASSSRL